MEHFNGRLRLSLGGSKRTLLFDYRFVSFLFDLIPRPVFNEEMTRSPWRTLPVIVTAALLSAEDENELPDNLSERLVGRWLTSLSLEEGQLVRDLFEHSMGADFVDEETPKKPVQIDRRRKPQPVPPPKPIDWKNLLTTASATGLKPAEFWRMTPLAFRYHVEGYQQSTHRESMQWRELMALLYNINRGEKSKVLSGKDFWPLPIDEVAEPSMEGLSRRERIELEDKKVGRKRISQKRFNQLWRICNPGQLLPQVYVDALPKKQREAEILKRLSAFTPRTREEYEQSLSTHSHLN